MSYARAGQAPRTMLPEEQAKLLEVSGKHVDGFRDHMIISMALGTALREHEIAALDIRDIVNGAVTLAGHAEIRTKIALRTFARKGAKPSKAKLAAAARAKRAGRKTEEKSQLVFLPKMVRIKLKKYVGWMRRSGLSVAPDAPIFTSNRGSRIALRTMRHLFRTWQRRANFETLYTFHELRHTALSNLYKRTKDVLLVQKHARHASVTTTQMYAHVSDDDTRRAVEDLPS